MRLLLLLAALFCMGLQAGCGSDETSHRTEGLACGEVAPGKTKAEGEVSGGLVVETAAVGPGQDLLYRVRNRGQVTLHFGGPFTVDSWDGDGWESADDAFGIGPDSAWTGIGYTAAPKSSTQKLRVATPADLDSGTYRLRIEVSDRGGGDGILLLVCGDFEVT